MSDYARRLPKAELHVHLEGAIRPETLLTLAERHRIALPAHDLEGVRDFYRFRDFLHFIDVYTTICRCLRTPEDFYLVTKEFLAYQASLNVKYCETFFAPGHFIKQDADLGAIVDAITQARKEAARDLGVRMELIADISREMGAEFGVRIAKEMVRIKDRGVLGIGIGGAEAEFPAEWFEEAFRLGREAGMPVVAHAGEADGPKSVWSALNVLKAQRIGHGVRSIEDPALIAHLRDHQIPLEVCPTSNTCIGIYPDYAAHPLRKLVEAGCMVTLNSDDPPMFETDLVREYDVAITEFGLSRDQIEQIVLNGIRASFLSDAEKKVYLASFEAELATLRAEPLSV
ncbi:MAG TPA: adenosine deaminase [Pantanalinema sp.]